MWTETEDMAHLVLLGTISHHTLQCMKQISPHLAKISRFQPSSHRLSSVCVVCVFVRERNPKAACECGYVVLSLIYGGNIEMRGGENEGVRQAEGQTGLEEGQALMVLSPRCR